MERSRLSIRALVVLASELGAEHLFGVRDPFMICSMSSPTSCTAWRSWSRAARSRGNLKARRSCAAICGGSLKSVRNATCI